MDFDITIDIPCSIRLEEDKWMRVVGIDYSLGHPALIVKYMTQAQYVELLRIKE